MAKNRHQPEPTSNRSTMAVLVVGGVLVAGLVVWALTRSVEPATESVMATTTEVSTAPAPAAAASSTQPVPPSSTGITTGTSSLPPSVATGQPVPPPPVQGDRSSVQRIAVEDLRAKLNRNEVTVLDVRDARAFATGHIPGSINVPFASVETMLDTIPKDKPIVTYCT